jgi:hypothetical protein
VSGRWKCDPAEYGGAVVGRAGNVERECSGNPPNFVRICAGYARGSCIAESGIDRHRLCAGSAPVHEWRAECNLTVPGPIRGVAHHRAREVYRIRYSLCATRLRSDHEERQQRCRREDQDNLSSHLSPCFPLNVEVREPRFAASGETRQPARRCSEHLVGHGRHVLER